MDGARRGGSVGMRFPATLGETVGKELGARETQQSHGGERDGDEGPDGGRARNELAKRRRRLQADLRQQALGMEGIEAAVEGEERLQESVDGERQILDHVERPEEAEDRFFCDVGESLGPVRRVGGARSCGY